MMLLRQRGLSWQRLAEIYDCSRECIRYHLDPFRHQQVKQRAYRQKYRRSKKSFFKKLFS